MNKVYILAVLAIFSLIPQPAQAVRIGNIMDPLCLFSWRDGCKDNINIDNSINDSFNTNINSNVNSPGGTVSDNNSTIIDDTSGGGYYENPRPNTSSLYVTCDADDSYVDVDDRVTWSAYATGGNGSYNYDWSGSEGLDGDDDEVSIRYDREGTKNASVRVTSGSQSVTRSCGSVDVRDDWYNGGNYYDDNSGYYYDNYDYRPSVSCYPETTYTDTGSLVVWRAYANGGDGRYSYTWSGTDSLSGRSDAISRTYSRPGVKSASVTVRSNNRSTSASCGSVTIYSSLNTTYVPSYTPTYSGTLSASCSPSTGKTTPGKVVTWSVYPTGGSGIYTYYWSGTDGFSGGQKSVVTSYRSTGTKYASVTVFSQGKSTTISCGAVSISAATVKPIVKKPTTIPATSSKEITEPTSDKYSLSKVFSGVPWILVFILIIVLLFSTVIYLLMSKKG